MRMEHRILAVSIGLGPLYWALDAFLSSFLFHEGAFWDRLIADVPPYRICTRIAVLGISALVGTALSRAYVKQQRTEEALRESEERFRDVFDNSMVGLYRTTPGGDILMANPALLRMLGYSSFEELAQRNLEEEGYEPEHPRSVFKQRIESEGQVVGLEAAWTRRDGRPLFVRESVRAIRDQTGNTLYYEGTVEDVTKRKRAEEALRESEERYRRLVESVDDMIFSVDRDGVFRTAAGARLREFGLTTEDVVGRTVYDLFPQEQARRFRQQQQQTFNSETPMTYEGTYEFAGLKRTELTTLYPIEDASGQVELVGIICRDITERKRAEERIEASLREKEVLLKEIHHRVKNNLQLISNLLELQCQFTQDPQVIPVFQDIQNRVMSMGLVHERLCQSQNLARISVAEYIQSLADYLYGIYGNPTDAIVLDTHIDDVSLGIDAAIPCGLIVCELVSNALRHAFPSGEGGKICIELHSDDDDQLTLVVSDNGIGLDPNLDFKDSPSLGLQLVNLLTKQLKGRIELDRSAGTAFKITFVDALVTG